MAVTDVITLREGRTEPLDLDLYQSDADGQPVLITGLESLTKIEFRLRAMTTGQVWTVNTVDDATRLSVVPAPPEGRVRFTPAGEFVYDDSEKYEGYFLLTDAAGDVYSVPNAYDKRFRVLYAF